MAVFNANHSVIAAAIDIVQQIKKLWAHHLDSEGTPASKILDAISSVKSWLRGRPLHTLKNQVYSVAWFAKFQANRSRLISWE